MEMRRGPYLGEGVLELKEVGDTSGINLEYTLGGLLVF